MYGERRERVAGILRQHGIGFALFSDAASVRYLTGYTTQIETGLNPFEGAPAMCLLTEGAAVLIASEDEAAGFAAPPGTETAGYPAYSIEENLDGARELARVTVGALRTAGFTGGALGLEPRVTQSVAAAIAAAFPATSFRDVSGPLGAVRAVKDEAEIEILRRAARLSAFGQMEVRRILRAGLSEIELYSAVHGAMELAAGCRVPLLADVVSGPRSGAVGGPPTTRVIEAGDAVLTDLVPGLEGYWGDSCLTLVAGRAPDADLERLHRVSLEALELGIAAVRPGILSRELDAICRGHVAAAGFSYPHHTGHGIGATYHEAPRIIPGDATVLQAGMVIALEPGAYLEGRYGVRVEDLLLVTADGCEILTDHDKSLSL